VKHNRSLVFNDSVFGIVLITPQKSNSLLTHKIMCLQ